MSSPSTRTGYICALAALTTWGVLPAYWKQLGAVPSIEVIGHRAVWSVVFLLFFCAFKGSLGELFSIARSPKKLATLALSGTLIACNWLGYVWGVNHDRVVEASLGYFLSPLLTVALGALVLQERLSPRKKLAVGLAALGVVLKTLSAGTVPWIGLMLAFSMSLYGFIRKQIGVSALVGLTLETVILAPIALTYLGYLSLNGESHFLSEGGSVTLLLALTGVATSLPLIWFVRASQLLPLSTLGVLQYLSPSLQFLSAVVVFREAMTVESYVSFSFIWLAIVVYLSADILPRLSRTQAVHPQEKPAIRTS